VAGRQGIPLQAVLAQGFGEAGGLGIGLLAGLAGLVEVAAGAGDGLVEGGLCGGSGGAVEQLGAGLAVGVEAGCKLAGRVEGGGAVLAGLAGGVFGSGQGDGEVGRAGFAVADTLAVRQPGIGAGLAAGTEGGRVGPPGVAPAGLGEGLVKGRELVGQVLLELGEARAILQGLAGAVVLQLEPGQLAGGVGELAGRGIGGLLGGVALAQAVAPAGLGVQQGVELGGGFELPGGEPGGQRGFTGHLQLGLQRVSLPVGLEAGGGVEVGGDFKIERGELGAGGSLGGLGFALLPGELLERGLGAGDALGQSVEQGIDLGRVGHIGVIDGAAHRARGVGLELGTQALGGVAGDEAGHLEGAGGGGELLLQGRAGGGGLAEAGGAVGEAGLLDAAVGVEALAGALELAPLAGQADGNGEGFAAAFEGGLVAGQGLRSTAWAASTRAASAARACCSAASRC
jgi:hypothetical protein